MKKNKYKKILYLLGLISVLSLTSCDNDKVIESKEIVETKDDDCLKKHLDLKILSNVQKNIADSDIFYSLREKFLNDLDILNINNINNKCLNNLNSSYLYLFDNEQIINRLSYYIEIYDNIEFYEEYILKGNDYLNLEFDYQIDDINATFFIESEIGKNETILELLKDNTNNFFTSFSSTKVENLKYEYFDTMEIYRLSSIEKTGLNNISIELSINYNIHNESIMEGKYTCRKFSSILKLSNNSKQLKINLDEETTEKVKKILKNSFKDGRTIENILKENEEIFVKLYNENYVFFIQEIDKNGYTLKRTIF